MIIGSIIGQISTVDAIHLKDFAMMLIALITVIGVGVNLVNGFKIKRKEDELKELFVTTRDCEIIHSAIGQRMNRIDNDLNSIRVDIRQLGSDILTKDDERMKSITSRMDAMMMMLTNLKCANIDGSGK
jgi:hypothetical protein